MRVIATAGHVDHGKSTLVQALTGMDPDRLAEEKARGLTIDLGFAWTTLPSGEELAFVDVPGHSRFIRNMLAGVGMVDACLFVVAATEGWKPQSEEHLRILELLGIGDGLVALTKVGSLDDERRRLARADIVRHLGGTFLERAPIVDVDPLAGIGVEAVYSALGDLSTTRRPPDNGRPRLWIDRAFTVRGSGTVVTGTLTGGSLRVGDALSVIPGYHGVRVRGLQTLKRTQESVSPGSRVAVSLAGAALAHVARGRALVQADQWRPTRMVDATLEVLASLSHAVSRRGAYALYVGSGEHRVTLRLLGAGAVSPGQRGHVRLHLAVDLPLVAGDRYVLREDGRAETVGGGEILDVAPVLPTSKAHPTRDIDCFVAERGWVDVDELEATTGVRREPTVGRWIVAPDALAATVQSIREAVAAAGALGLDIATLGEQSRAVLATMADVTVDRGRARASDGDALHDPLADHPYVVALDAAPFSPPEPIDVDPAELRELVRQARIVHRNGIYFAPSAIRRAAHAIADLLANNQDGVTVSQVRVALGTSRKYAVPLLAELDAAGITRRKGDFRVAGPRLPPSDGRTSCDGRRGGGGRESNPPSQEHCDHPL